jgi:Ala-tRNA(Pro) deacylase
MSIIDGWLAYLRQRQVTFSHSVHARADTAAGTALAEKMPAHELAKTVVYASNRGFGLAVVPADCVVDLRAVQRTLALTSVRLADEGEITELFPDCEVGAMPPFGDTRELPVIMDKTLAADYIAFTIGTHRDLVRITFADFSRLARPVVGSIATPANSCGANPCEKSEKEAAVC